MRITRLKRAEGRCIQLSPRELSILRLVCVGESSDKGISKILGITTTTVHGIVSQMLASLGCRNRVELLMWGLLRPATLETGFTQDLPHEPGCTCPCVECRSLWAAGMTLTELRAKVLEEAA